MEGETEGDEGGRERERGSGLRERGRRVGGGGEGGGSGGRARSLREEMKAGFPSPGKPRRRCHECDY